MSILFEAGDGTEPERRTFRDWAERDIRSAFLNPEEMAETRTIRYDGVSYEDIPVVEVGPKEGKRPYSVQTKNEFGQGLYKRSVTIYCDERDLDGNKPEQGSMLYLNEKQGGTFFHKYRVAESVTELGIFCVKLEEVDE